MRDIFFSGGNDKWGRDRAASEPVKTVCLACVCPPHARAGGDSDFGSRLSRANSGGTCEPPQALSPPAPNAPRAPPSPPQSRSSRAGRAAHHMQLNPGCRRSDRARADPPSAPTCALRSGFNEIAPGIAAAGCHRAVQSSRSNTMRLALRLRLRRPAERDNTERGLRSGFASAVSQHANGGGAAAHAQCASQLRQHLTAMNLTATERERAELSHVRRVKSKHA
jgi:hypothetical protein